MTGIRCPSCQSKSIVLKTITIDGTLRRTRRCTLEACRHRFATREAIIGQFAVSIRNLLNDPVGGIPAVQPAVTINHGGNDPCNKE